MSKNVLILSGTPRKNGNSEILCNEFQKGAEEAGNYVKRVNLREKEIHYCKGCGVCNSTHKCVQKDDMAEILDQMVQADVIVMATPVYFYTMDAQMKTLIDRTVPRYTEKANMERTLEGFRGFTEDCLDGAVEKGIIYGVGAWQKGDIEKTPAMKEAYKMGKNIS